MSLKLKRKTTVVAQMLPSTINSLREGGKMQHFRE